MAHHDDREQDVRVDQAISIFDSQEILHATEPWFQVSLEELAADKQKDVLGLPDVERRFWLADVTTRRLSAKSPTALNSEG